MKLLVIRHARAENAEEFGKANPNDDLRPLTEDGRARMQLACAGLHRVVLEINLLASSPLARARQTADIVAAEYGGLAIVEIDQLRPDAELTALYQWLQEAGEQATVAVVGHDAHLNPLVGWLLTGKPKTVVRIKKGGAVMLKMRRSPPDRERSRRAVLLWSLTASQLRMLSV